MDRHSRTCSAFGILKKSMLVSRCVVSICPFTFDQIICNIFNLQFTNCRSTRDNFQYLLRKWNKPEHNLIKRIPFTQLLAEATMVASVAHFTDGTLESLFSPFFFTLASNNLCTCSIHFWL